MQCKDIPDAPVLAFLSSIPGENPWATWYWPDEKDRRPENSVLHAMPAETPVKLARSKMKMLTRRGLVDGCHCGCRGDYELTSRGRELLALMKDQQFSASSSRDRKAAP